VRAAGRSQAIGRVAAVLALTVAGCGAGHPASSASVRLQREDLVAVGRALAGTETAVAKEVAVTKAAWPLVANGLPSDPSVLARPPIQAAGDTAGKIPVPTLFGEAQAASITGPGSSIAGLFRSYSGLATRGWEHIDADIDEIEHGTPVAVRFARANVALYIESVYDAHFSLAQIGKQFTAAYEKLGGPDAFGSTLTQAEVDHLAAAFSEEADRLHPHVGVRLGS
jgi:hypothetical protein